MCQYQYYLSYTLYPLKYTNDHMEYRKILFQEGTLLFMHENYLVNP